MNFKMKLIYPGYLTYVELLVVNLIILATGRANSMISNMRNIDRFQAVSLNQYHRLTLLENLKIHVQLGNHSLEAS